jgi:hypothetical protein
MTNAVCGSYEVRFLANHAEYLVCILFRACGDAVGTPNTNLVVYDRMQGWRFYQPFLSRGP